MTNDPIPFPVPTPELMGPAHDVREGVLGRADATRHCAKCNAPGFVLSPQSTLCAACFTQLWREREEAEAAASGQPVLTDPVLSSLDAQDAVTQAMPNPDHPFPDDQVAETDPARKPTEQTVKIVRCTKCKAAIETAMVTGDNAQLCARCFSLLVNQVGVPADPASKPTRISFQIHAPPEVVRKHERVLPEQIEDALRTAAIDFGAELRGAFFAGDAKLFNLLAQAKEHGLTLLVVVQPTIKPPAAPTAPARRP